MSIVTMNMSEYGIERSGSLAEADIPQYGDEVLYAGWNPALALQQHTETTQAAAMPRELAKVDVESFLDKMYAYQR